MGAETMRERIRELVPTAQFQSRARLSRLSYAGRSKLESLPPRTAVVAFSAAQVYELAERIQRAHGGTAVVLGALSPRTRNAQVAMYQAGEVNYLVATDAIGMGLNMDVDTVAFAALRKFDGQRERMLEPAELAQIAGRAGRHMNDGAFATLAPLPTLDPDLVFALENHTFPSVRRVQWRNSDLDLSSLDALIASLRKRPYKACLRMVDGAEDGVALQELASKPEVRSLANRPERVALLWAVCQVPDFRQLLLDSHIGLLEQVFKQLCSPNQVIDESWFAQKLNRLDDTQGDIETLMRRISFVRTWTYVANHEDWVNNAQTWQQTARDIEDRLSDALHHRLVQRFVTQHRNVKTRRSASRGRSHAPVVDAAKPNKNSPFHVLSTWRLGPALHPLVEVDRVEAMVDAEHDAFRVDAKGRIFFESDCVARLAGGADILRPEVILESWEGAGAGARMRLHRRLLAFVRDWVGELLTPLNEVPSTSLSPAAKGLLFQLEQRLGTVRMDQAREQAAGLTHRDREVLKSAGITVGSHIIFSRTMTASEQVRKRVLLCMTYLSVFDLLGAPDGSRSWCELDERLEPSVYTAMGYPVYGNRGLRADMVERVMGTLGRQAARGPFQLSERLCHWMGIQPNQADQLMAALGYRRLTEGRNEPLVWKRTVFIPMKPTATSRLRKKRE
jgi:ATP-dependent RNA helicase SUPV3L1/SUV3